jgi:hypothetical protein
MPSSTNPTKMPTKPAQRLEAFGRALSRRPSWKTLLADAMHVPKRTMSYWLAGHTPKDLDARLKVLATEMIAEQSRCADVMRVFRDQLEKQQGAV